ncbi:MAG: hypothetical protein ACLPWS_10830, partial [Rhodomicrobium sp.]
MAQYKTCEAGIDYTTLNAVGQTSLQRTRFAAGRLDAEDAQVIQGAINHDEGGRRLIAKGNGFFPRLPGGFPELGKSAVNRRDVLLI